MLCLWNCRQVCAILKDEEQDIMTGLEQTPPGTCCWMTNLMATDAFHISSSSSMRLDCPSSKVDGDQILAEGYHCCFVHQKELQTQGWLAVGWQQHSCFSQGEGLPRRSSGLARKQGDPQQASASFAGLHMISSS